jgi:hypothetical protein
MSADKMCCLVAAELRAHGLGHATGFLRNARGGNAVRPAKGLRGLCGVENRRESDRGAPAMLSNETERNSARVARKVGGLRVRIDVAGENTFQVSRVLGGNAEVRFLEVGRIQATLKICG